MAIQPTIRPFGSGHIIRFQGTLVAGATPQTLNATLPATAAPTANAALLVKFALADLTDLTDTSTALPIDALDDTTGGQYGVQTGTFGPSAGGGNVPAGPTWAQNIRVRMQELGASSATPLLARIDELTPVAYYDTATSGLNGNTGVAVVGINIYPTAAGVTAIGTAGAPGAGIGVIVEIEVPYSPTR